jgi:hypothetical protein
MTTEHTTTIEKTSITTLSDINDDDIIYPSSVGDVDVATLSSEELKLPNVPNVINSCYIDAVLIALFLPEQMDYHLCKDMKQPIGSYLQMIIKNDIIDKLRFGEPVSYHTMTMLRQQMIEIGWKTFGEEFDQQDAKEFYEFILEKMEISMINIRRVTFTGGVSDNSDTGKIETIPYIPVNVDYDDKYKEDSKIKLFDMVYKWLNDNTTTAMRKPQQGASEIQMNVLNTYKIENSPPIFGFAINRFPSPDKRMNFELSCSSIFVPFKYDKDEHICKMAWEIQGLICHRPSPVPVPIPKDYSPLKSGHYYCVVIANKKTYIFDDLETPSLCEINIQSSLSDTIKREIVFVIYREKLPE